MQRRVAAVYFVFFLVMGASAYSVIALADAPTVQVQGETYATNDTFTVGGQQYTVSEFSTQEGETTGTLTYTNESFRSTEQLSAGSNVSYRNGTYQVQIPNGSNVSNFTLRQQFNVSQILRDDPNVENQTLTREDGTTYVRYTNGTLQPLDAYLPAPETYSFSTGERFRYQGNRTNVSEVTSDAVTLAWIGPSEQTTELTEGGNVTLGDREYFAHFEGSGDNVRVVLAPTQQQYPAYSNQLAQQDYFHERMKGLWGVVILSALAAIIIVALAYMPVRG